MSENSKVSKKSTSSASSKSTTPVEPPLKAAVRRPRMSQEQAPKPVTPDLKGQSKIGCPSPIKI